MRSMVSSEALPSRTSSKSFSSVPKPMRQGTHFPQDWAWHIFKKDAAMSTGQSPEGLALMRRSTSLYNSSTVACALFCVMILSLLIVPPVIQRLKKISSFVFLIVIIFTDSNYFIIRTPGSQIKMNVYNKDRTYFYIFRQRGGSIFSSFFSAFFLLPPPSFFYGSFPFPNRRKKRKRQAFTRGENRRAKKAAQTPKSVFYGAQRRSRFFPLFPRRRKKSKP